jgi:3',5'-cyclic AMP phosphodiesterase CpdA
MMIIITKNRQLTLALVSTLILINILPNITCVSTINTKHDVQNMQDLSYNFTIVWMTDTQFYSQKYPNIFKNITNWIVAQQDTGDIVQNFPALSEWIKASRIMRQLEDSNIPYGVLAGNHDNGLGIFHIFYNLFFGKWRFYKNELYSGSFHRNQNHYDLFSFYNTDFIVLYLSYGITNNEFEWAHSVLQQHNKRHAIIAVHEYIKKGGNYTGQGEDIFNRLVVPNDNVFMVLCGHKHDVELNTKIIEERNVYEILANYQSEPLGGSGYIRLLHFAITDEQLYVKTYSPYLDDYNYHPSEDDEFILNLDLSN